MQTRAQITDDLHIGSQPSREDVAQLKQEGLQTVINLRVNHEDPEMPDPAAEESDWVRGQQLTYLSLPVSMKQLRPEQVDEFCNAVDNLPKPIFVHCKAAKRAATFVAIREARKQGLSANEAIKLVEKHGIQLQDKPFADFIRLCVQQ